MDPRPFIEEMLGLNKRPEELTFLMIGLRACIMFFAVLLMIRISEIRFLAGRNALDRLLGFLLASMLARAINGSERFFESIAAGFLLVILHRWLAWAGCHSHKVGKLIKGNPTVLISDAKLNAEAMEKLHLSENDLKEDLRLKTGSDDLNLIVQAQLERNGEISFQKKLQ